MAFVALPLAKKALAFACDQGAKQLGEFVKTIVHANEAKICSPEFPSLLVSQMVEMMKASRVFPGKIREYIEAHPDVLSSFTNELVQLPQFKNACASQDMARVDSIIDGKLNALKGKLILCTMGGRRRKTRKSKARKMRRTQRR